MNAEVVLSQAEASALDDCEQRIEKGLRTFVEVGTALLRIRDERLYRTQYDTFEDYCRERWQMNRQRASQMIQAAGVSKILDNGPTTESHARELVGLEPQHAQQVWEKANETTAGKPTARAVREARQETEQILQQASEQIAEQQQAWTDAAEAERRMAEQTAHMNDRVNAERPYALAVLAVVDGLEQMPLDQYDPRILAGNIPEHVRYRLQDVAKHAQWLIDFLHAYETGAAA